MRGCTWLFQYMRYEGLLHGQWAKHIYHWAFNLWDMWEPVLQPVLNSDFSFFLDICNRNFIFLGGKLEDFANPIQELLLN